MLEFPIELAKENPHSSDLDFCDCDLPRNFKDIGKKFIEIKWIQMRWLTNLTLQIRSNENEEWQTVYKLKEEEK